MPTFLFAHDGPGKVTLEATIELRLSPDPLIWPRDHPLSHPFLPPSALPRLGLGLSLLLPHLVLKACLHLSMEACSAPLPSWTTGHCEQRAGLSGQHVQRPQLPSVSSPPSAHLTVKLFPGLNLPLRAPGNGCTQTSLARKENNSPKNVISSSIYGFFPILKVTHNHY